MEEFFGRGGIGKGLGRIKSFQTWLPARNLYRDQTLESTWILAPSSSPPKPPSLPSSLFFPLPPAILSACACSIAQWCLTLCDPMECSPPGLSVHGILQARILEWVVMPSSRESSPPRDRTQVSCIFCIAGRFFTA